jgi:hypothetical protein
MVRTTINRFTLIARAIALHSQVTKDGATADQVDNADLHGRLRKGRSRSPWGKNADFLPSNITIAETLNRRLCFRLNS